MNRFLNIFLCFAIFTIAQSLTPDQRDTIMALHNDCSAETGVKDEVIMKAMEGDFSDDPKLKEHLLCFGKKVGFQNEAGELQPEVIKEKLKCIADEVKYDQVISQCIVQKSTPEETALEFSKCMSRIDHL